MSTTDSTSITTALKPRTRASNDQAKILRAAYKYQFDTFTTKQVLSTLEEQTGLPSKWIADWFSRERRKTTRKQKSAAESTSTSTLEVKAEPQDTPVRAGDDLTPALKDFQVVKPKSKAKARKTKRGVLKALISDPNLPKADQNDTSSTSKLQSIKEEYAEFMGSLSSPITIGSTPPRSPPPPQQQQSNAVSVSPSSRPLRTLQNSHAHNVILPSAGQSHNDVANSGPDAWQASDTGVRPLPSVSTLLCGFVDRDFNMIHHTDNQLPQEYQRPNWGTEKISLQGPRDPGMNLPLSQQFSFADWPNPACYDSYQLSSHQQNIYTHSFPRGHIGDVNLAGPAGPSRRHSSPALPSSPASNDEWAPRFTQALPDNSSYGFKDVLDARRAPLRHLTVIHDILLAYHRSTQTPFELLGEEGQVTPIGHLVVDRLTDEALANTDPFQASMGLVFLSRLGLKF